ncbi:MAG: nicotinate-nucleotide adenylyltransferase [Motiliproteus sp.]|jgi:nicotinate-nucleotide adenylyltransferase
MTEQGERPPSVAVLGGTFDPIHNGHLRLALELHQRLGFDQVRLLPCALPVHRESPGCSALQRLEMVELAVGHEPGLSVDVSEVRSGRPSYSFYTLQALRAELGEQTCLTLVMGTDAFLKLESWYRWQELLQQCHLLVVVRPGWSLPQQHPMSRWLEQHRVQRVEQLFERPAGSVLLQQLSALEISASSIRQQISAGQSPRFLLPDVVWRHIRQQGLYLSPPCDPANLY